MGREGDSVIFAPDFVIFGSDFDDHGATKMQRSLMGIDCRESGWESIAGQKFIHSWESNQGRGGRGVY